MKIVKKKKVPVMLLDTNESIKGYIDGKPYNWTWTMSVSEIKNEFYWFSLAGYSINHYVGPFSTINAAIDHGFETLEGIK